MPVPSTADAVTRSSSIAATAFVESSGALVDKTGVLIPLVERVYGEWTFDPLTEADQPKAGLGRIRGIFQVANTVNKNGRYYPREILEREVSALLERCKRGEVFVQANHPPRDGPRKDEPDALAQVGRLVDLWWEGDEVWGEIWLANTLAGQDIRALIEIEGRPGVSARGSGVLVAGKTPSGQTANIVQPSYSLKTYDIVIGQGFEQALVLPSISEQQEGAEMTLAEFKSKHPELYEALMKEAGVSLTEMAREEIRVEVSKELVEKHRDEFQTRLDEALASPEVITRLIKENADELMSALVEQAKGLAAKGGAAAPVLSEDAKETKKLLESQAAQISALQKKLAASEIAAVTERLLAGNANRDLVEEKLKAAAPETGDEARALIEMELRSFAAVSERALKEQAAGGGAPGLLEGAPFKTTRSGANALTEGEKKTSPLLRAARRLGGINESASETAGK